MSIEKNNSELTEKKAKPAANTKKKAAKEANFFVRIWKKFCKLCKDTAGEMKKVVWTPKSDVKKNTKLVVFTVIAIGVAVAIIDTAFALLINSLAGVIG